MLSQESGRMLRKPHNAGLKVHGIGQAILLKSVDDDGYRDLSWSGGSKDTVSLALGSIPSVEHHKGMGTAARLM